MRDAKKHSIWKGPTTLNKLILDLEKNHQNISNPRA